MCQLEFAIKILEASRKMRFGENIHSLASKRDKNYIYGVVSNMMTYQMTIKFDVFGTLMKDIIMRNLYGTSIVTIKHGS